MKLLIIEDNALLLESVVQLLSDEYTIDTATDGDEGLFLAEQNIYDAILLDVMLPGKDGFEVIKRLRAETINTPVLFLTAKDALEDRVKGLNLGADDYIVKPFQNMELEARISAILRRSSNRMAGSTLGYKGIVIDLRKKSITIDGDVLPFTIKQYELIEYLIKNAEQILTREQIYDRIWGFDSETSMGIVEVYIHQIRKKLQPYGYDKDVQTMRGIGYMLSSH